MVRHEPVGCERRSSPYDGHRAIRQAHESLVEGVITLHADKRIVGAV